MVADVRFLICPFVACNVRELISCKHSQLRRRTELERAITREREQARLRRHTSETTLMEAMGRERYNDMHARERLGTYTPPTLPNNDADASAMRLMEAMRVCVFVVCVVFLSDSIVTMVLMQNTQTKE